MWIRIRTKHNILYFKWNFLQWSVRPRAVSRLCRSVRIRKHYSAGLFKRPNMLYVNFASHGTCDASVNSDVMESEWCLGLDEYRASIWEGCCLLEAHVGLTAVMMTLSVVVKETKSSNRKQTADLLLRVELQEDSELAFASCCFSQLCSRLCEWETCLNVRHDSRKQHTNKSCQVVSQSLTCNYRDICLYTETHPASLYLLHLQRTLSCFIHWPAALTMQVQSHSFIVQMTFTFQLTWCFRVIFESDRISSKNNSSLIWFLFSSSPKKPKEDTSS